MTMIDLLSLTRGVPSDLGFTEEHAMVAKQARRLLTERVPTTEVRRLVDDPVGHSPELYREMASLGWLSLALPENAGGTGLGVLALALLCEEMGRVALPSPFRSAALAALAIAHAGSAEQRAEHLAAITSGERIATVAFDEHEASGEPDEITAAARVDGGGYLLSGKKVHVPFAHAASVVIAPFRFPEGDVALFVVPLSSPGVRVEPERDVDLTWRGARVTFEDARVSETARLAGDGITALARLLAIGRVLLSAEMVGGAESVLTRTRDYAIDRRQFDRPIGAFQAVKHPLVDVMVGIELSRSLTLSAAAALDHAPEAADTLSRMAKSMTGDVFSLAVKKGVQLHGGFGFTWECDIHLWFRRALVARAALGDGIHHRKKLAEKLAREHVGSG
jgi:alkylation response protein AidB-like acyl-CoA dehydrogenase